MVKRLKKAFTIVELVIVIAVIAILAAVLIPTFVNVTKKANLSNDQSQIRQMNTVAAMESATDNFVYAGDAVKALYNNGWNTSKLSTYSGGYHYAFSLRANTWYLLDEKGEVVFPDSNVKKDDLWVLYNNQSMDVVEGVTNYIAVDNVTNDQHYSAGFNNNNNYTIDLNGGYIATTTSLTNVTVKNGILLSGAQGDNESVSSDYTLADTWVPSQLTYNKVIFTNKVGTYETANKAYNISTASSGDVTFTDCVFYNLRVHGNTSGTLTFENCKFYSLSGSAWAITSSGNAENLIVRNCEFTNCARGVNISGSVCNSNSGTRKILIENNVFNGATGDRAIIQLGMKYAESTTYTTINTDIVIKNNTFNALGNALGLVRVHKTLGSETNSTDKVNGVANIVTFENNTVDSSIDSAKYVIKDDENYTSTKTDGGTYGDDLVAALLAKFK